MTTQKERILASDAPEIVLVGKKYKGNFPLFYNLNAEKPHLPAGFKQVKCGVPFVRVSDKNPSTKRTGANKKISVNKIRLHSEPFLSWRCLMRTLVDDVTGFQFEVTEHNELVVTRFNYIKGVTPDDILVIIASRFRECSKFFLPIDTRTSGQSFFTRKPVEFALYSK